jgi:small nuclear ribonucleoprotein (snRNP)-like protein
MAYNDTRNPLRALAKRVGNKIQIRLKDSTVYQGILKEFDSYMNIILTDCTEKVSETEPEVQYKELFIRGNNILFVKPNQN